MKATAKQLFNRASMLNPLVSEISSMGSFVSSQNQGVADSMRNEMIDAVCENSLAYKILSTAKNFTDKQLWVIAFELQKNEEYSAKVASELDSIIRRKNAKKQAKKDNNQAILDSFKSTPVVEASKTATFGIGTKVNSDKLGNGVIVEETEVNVTVDFEGNKKNLLKIFANLTII